MYMKHLDFGQITWHLKILPYLLLLIYKLLISWFFNLFSKGIFRIFEMGEVSMKIQLATDYIRLFIGYASLYDFGNGKIYVGIIDYIA